jgi:two-component system NarL family sensor kinase
VHSLRAGRHAGSIAGTLPLPSTRGSRWAALTLAVTVFGVVVVVATAWRSRAVPDAGVVFSSWPDHLVTIVCFGVTGTVLLDRRPDLPFGWLLAGGCALHVIGVTISLPSALAVLDGHRDPVALWGITAGSLLFVQLPIQGLINVRFPTGRPSSRRARAMEVAIVVGGILAVAGGVFGATANFRTDPPIPALAGVEHPLTGGTTIGRVADGMQAFAPVVVLLTLVAGIGVVIRFFRAEGLVRQQLKWRAADVMISLVLFPFAITTGVGFVDRADNLVFVLTLAIPVLRYRLWAIDTIIRRSAVYAVVTVVLGLGYVAVTVAGARLVSERVGATVAAIAVAAAFAPFRSRAQRVVDRLFYGQRSEPYRTLTDLGRRLDGAAVHGQVLRAIVEGVTESLRLPYAAIERAGDRTTLAAAGEPGPVIERWPLTYEGQVEGWLVASARRGEATFDGRDRELLGDLARHAGVAVHAEALTADLLSSRQRLVTAREEERRRLRRDLHDELGPVLTGLGLNLDAARARLASDPATAERHIVDARSASSQAIADLRRVVYGLRPPALDDLGLVGAVRAQAERLRADSSLVITVEADEMQGLPAAVEVAAYRTAIEAVANTVRHAGARSCSVRLRRVGCAVHVVVEDDGVGGNGWAPGVGLTSMRERAEELGGTFAASAVAGGGARVVATLPLPEPNP